MLSLIVIFLTDNEHKKKLYRSLRKKKIPNCFLRIILGWFERINISISNAFFKKKIRLENKTRKIYNFRLRFCKFNGFLHHKNFPG